MSFFIDHLLSYPVRQNSTIWHLTTADHEKYMMLLFDSSWYTGISCIHIKKYIHLTIIVCHISFGSYETSLVHLNVKNQMEHEDTVCLSFCLMNTVKHVKYNTTNLSGTSGYALKAQGLRLEHSHMTHENE